MSTLDRRALLGRLLAALGGLGVAPAARAALPPPPPSPPVPVRLAEVPVFGLPYHDAPRVLPSLAEGDALVLRREVHNPHDAAAVAVHTPQGAKLGFVARESVGLVSRLLDAGYPVRATLRAIRPNGWQRLVVEVEAVLPPPHR